jgi:hypothetical protein
MPPNFNRTIAMVQFMVSNMLSTRVKIIADENRETMAMGMIENRANGMAMEEGRGK